MQNVRYGLSGLDLHCLMQGSRNESAAGQAKTHTYTLSDPASYLIYPSKTLLDNRPKDSHPTLNPRVNLHGAKE